ncbi:uncharacterized protein TNCV_5049031 [Trichonephila clavipes]|nr:uncharacterized protein TNCV_5049031 [Trichonephila clavipes]
MGDFTYAEKMDMHHMFGRAKVVTLSTSKTDLFHFSRHDASRLRALRSPSLEEIILNVVADKPETSTRAVAHRVTHAYYRSDLMANVILFFRNSVTITLMRNVPIAIRNRMWFQCDGVPDHFSTDVCTYLNATIAARWIGHGGPIPWSPRSPNLSSLDYFFMGHLKNLAYATLFDLYGDLVVRISEFHQSLHRRCLACIATGGNNFEQLL